MAWSINKRVRKDGSIRYRVISRIKGNPTFSLTFDDYKEACIFIETNEGEFTTNPEKFFAWRANLRAEMRRKGVKVENHILAPRLQIPLD